MTSRQTSAVATIIGIDIGTSGVRAAALADNGDLVEMVSAPFLNADEGRSPSSWWARTSAALTELAAKASLSCVRAIGVDGTSGTVLAIDSAGEPVGAPLMYNDACPDPSIVESISRHAPADSPARGSSSALARAIHLSRQPQVSRVVHQADWILMKLGHDGCASDENNALKTGYDLVAEEWPDWIEWAGLDRRLLPIVQRAGAPLSVTTGFIRNLGVDKTCRFHAGTTDGCASFLATGASQIGDGVTALGSTLVLKLASELPINAPQYGIYSHRVLDFWLPGGASNSGGGVIRSLFGDNRLEELTKRIDPDQPTGLDFYPLPKAGERFPISDPNYAPGLEPRPADEAIFFQAVLEGITEIERLGYERLTELGAARLRSVRTVGGGAKNPVWTRMRQAVLAVPFAASNSTEAAVGTASLILQWQDRQR
ncbi:MULTISPECIES: FGGY-family carbohydrate kinase [Rhizobium]|uniref:Sugar (Pentulose or hexulose) kinase n=1 Tax=Rhizobium tropici TaxID=398 RepID=A0ABR6R2J0_RHITR|nr:MULTISPECIES: FGGY-family carbohydrate kinase [Rhizobium]AGB75014.1 carbohydrate kinase [Rhizobium tropici CIAT 899]MBB4243042.1 sugar (pentulose or hexulose) kinase [Rhizobium tropici]MBB5594543.1 sugar (pentulose or hexulose) kinase [Rhizobium tropici]MBB6493368.1 sugar (pentulose or hexulose) kinase [Rhizobium tropici]